MPFVDGEWISDEKMSERIRENPGWDEDNCIDPDESIGGHDGESNSDARDPDSTDEQSNHFRYQRWWPGV